MTKIMDSYIKNALDEKNQVTGELQRVREATKKATQDLETLRASVGQHDDALASLHRLLLRMEQEKQTSRGVEEQKEGHSKAVAEALAPIEAKVAKLEAAAGETPPLRRLHDRRRLSPATQPRGGQTATLAAPSQPEHRGAP